MIKAVLHFFKIHREMILGNPTIIIQNMFSKTPKPFNAVDMIFCFLIHHIFRMVHFVMFSQTFERIVAPKGIGVVHGTLPRFLPDDSHKFFFGYMFHDSRINLAIALQKAKYNAFASRATPSFPFSSTTEVGLVHFYLTFQLLSVKFGHMINHLTQMLVYPRYGLVVCSQIMRQAIRRLLLIEPLHDCNLRSDTLQRFLFSTAFVSASDISATSLRNLERTAENALFSSQKVGRTTENVLLTCNHKGILTPLGYETH